MAKKKSILEEIRDNAKEADPNLLKKLKKILKKQKKCPTEPNPFRTATEKQLKDFFKKYTLKR